MKFCIKEILRASPVSGDFPSTHTFLQLVAHIISRNKKMLSRYKVDYRTEGRIFHRALTPMEKQPLRAREGAGGDKTDDGFLFHGFEGWGWVITRQFATAVG